MMTRGFSQSGYAAGPASNPPPLHVYCPEQEKANWHPYERPPLADQHPGPIMIFYPSPTGNALGDDPTDPSACVMRRTAGPCGMMGGFHLRVSSEAGS